MKPAWEKLENDADILKMSTAVVGDMDCTVHKDTCGKMGVQGYPTIKHGSTDNMEDYKGGRDLDSLRKFASTELGPGCSVDTMENCDDAQKKELEKYIAMPAGERDTKLTELKKAMADAEEEHNALLKTLQATFKESQEKMEKLKEDSAPQIKLLKAATPGPKKDGAKDEV